MPFMLLVSTISKVQATFVQLEALIKGIIDDKSIIMQSVNQEVMWRLVLTHHLEIRTLKRTWGPGIYLFNNCIMSPRFL